ANHVDAGFQEGLGGGVMSAVGNHDGNEIDALVGGKRGFLRCHLLEGAVNAGGIKPQFLSRFPGFGGIAGECACYEFGLPVESRRHTVHGADESADAAPDHSASEFTLCHSDSFHSLRLSL